MNTWIGMFLSPFVLAGCALCLNTAPTASPQASWTVMVYLNGDNDLEHFALANFAQMAAVTKSNKVNIVVQFDRIAKYDNHNGNWPQTLRFKVEPHMAPLTTTAVQDIGEANMGDGKTLSDFVDWTVAKYPASRYALVIWDHGQGWRDDPDQLRRIVRSATASPFKTVSYDETNQDQLYVREIQNALQTEIVSKNVLHGKKLDLLGFDACLMAMLETSYAVRNVADVMVGSQELEPADGWPYNLWLEALVAHPEMTGQDLGRTIVDSYRAYYGNPSLFSNNATTTLSAIDLSEVPELARRLSTLASMLITMLPTEEQNIRQARAVCPLYAQNAFSDGRNYFFHIDLTCFTAALAKNTSNPSVRQEADAVTKFLMSSVVLNNYVGQARLSYGSSGLCIYFPSDLATYRSDSYAENGYEKSNEFNAVEFVQSEKWSDFLHAYYARGVQ